MVEIILALEEKLRPRISKSWNLRVRENEIMMVMGLKAQ